MYVCTHYIPLHICACLIGSALVLFLLPPPLHLMLGTFVRVRIYILKGENKLSHIHSTSVDTVDY